MSTTSEKSEARRRRKALPLPLDPIRETLELDPASTPLLCWKNRPRPATNARNRKTPRNNTSGYMGVTWHKRDRKWVAQIMVKGRHIHLGYFSTAEEAAAAYATAANFQGGPAPTL